MKLFYKHLLTLFLSLSIVAMSFSTASAAFKFTSIPKITSTPSLSGSSSASSSSTEEGDNDGSLTKSGSNGNNTSKEGAKVKVWWDISSDGQAFESPTSPAWAGGDGSGIARTLTADSTFQLKGKFYGSTKTLLNISADATMNDHTGYRAVSYESSVLGATLYNKELYNYDSGSQSLTNDKTKSKTFFSRTMPVWWFLKVKVAVGGQVGFDPNLRADNTRARADMEPFAGVTGTGEVIINLGVVKGGAGGKITLVEVGTPIDAEMRIASTDGYDTRICHTMKAKTTLEALGGTLYVWGKYWLPFKGWSKKYKKNVYSWSGLEWTLKSLYNKNGCQWI